MVGRGSARSLSDSVMASSPSNNAAQQQQQNLANQQQQQQQQRPVRFRPIVDDESQMMAVDDGNQQQQRFNSSNISTNATSVLSLASSSDNVETSTVVARNMRSMEVCCSAALTEMGIAAGDSSHHRLMMGGSGGGFLSQQSVSHNQHSNNNASLIRQNSINDTLVPTGYHNNNNNNNNNNHQQLRSSICLRHRLSRLFNSERMADIHFILTNTTTTTNNNNNNTCDGSSSPSPLPSSSTNNNEPNLTVNGESSSSSSSSSSAVALAAGAVRVPAHRLLLAVASPVFDAMFNGQGLAVDANAQVDVHIPDIELSAFMALLRFIYTDQVDLSPESVMAVLYAAKKYAVDSLQERCVEFLRSKLNKENAFLLLAQARLFDEPQLAALCLDVIDRHTNEAMSTESFVEIDRETLISVLQRDTLCIRERSIFSQCSRWAEAECLRLKLEPTSANKRRVLGPALPLVRFPLMTPEEFANDAAQSGLLENSELVSLFLWYLATPKPNVNLPPFSMQPRCCTAGRELTCMRFQHTELRWGYSGTADKIKFSVSRPIYIVGLGLYGSVTTGSHYSTVIQLIHCESREVRGQNEVEYDTDGSKKPFLVRFSEPVAIEPDTPYLASATIRGADTYYGTRGQRRVVVELMTNNNNNNNNNNASNSNNSNAISADDSNIINNNNNSTAMATDEMAAATASVVGGGNVVANNSIDNNAVGISSNQQHNINNNNNNSNNQTSLLSSSSSSLSSSSVTFSFSYACSSNNGTSVEDGQIPEIVFFA